jgi:Tol biopolymer transport system component
VGKTIDEDEQYMDHVSGGQLGQYQVLEELGRGGMAVVYKAYQPALERYVAIKVLPQQFTFDQEFVDRFLREARAAARLSHPHIVTIHDVGQADDTYFIVMEYLEGPSLADLIRERGALLPQQVARIVAQVASALDYAHGLGFVHRDVKPTNILLDARGAAQLTDFGIVKAAEGMRLTQTGTLLGTPEYMSPEQAKGLGLDHRSDVYSLGVVAYEMLMGRTPFSGETMAVLHAHVYDSPDLRSLSARLQEVLGRALAKNPEQRYASAEALARALQRAVAGGPMEPEIVEPPTRVVTWPRPRGLPTWAWGVGVLGAVALMVGIALALSSGEPQPSAAVAIPTRTTELVRASQEKHTPEPTETRPVPTSTATPAKDTLAEAEAISDTPTPTAIPEPSGRIAFDSYRDDNWEVYVMNADGSGLVNLTNNPADDGDPTWSPDSQSIAFDTDRDGNWEIYAISADGAGLTRLTSDPADDDSPAWSPDGRQVAFKSNRDGNWEIYVVDVSSLAVTNLTDHPAHDRLPAWSPDGKRIAFVSERTGNWDIYSMNADGSGLVNLTNHSAKDSFPAWSSDGDRLAFHSYRDGDAEIYVMNADGTGLIRLTRNVADDWGPDWSPDGSWIAFTSDRDGDNEIYVMRIDGSGVSRLTRNEASDTWPVWSPVAGAEHAFTDVPCREYARVLVR